MTSIDILFLIVGGFASAGWCLLAYASVREREHRAVVIAIVLLVLTAVTWSLLLIFFPGSLIQPVILALLAISALLFFLPFGRNAVMANNHVTERVDERDIMFAREEYEPGTEKYEAYYALRPELKSVDDRIRSLPPILVPGGRYYNAEKSEEIKAIFRQISALTTQCDGEVAPESATMQASIATAEIKNRVRAAGADEVGIARLNPMFVYSHVGRGPEPWGKKIELDHAFAIVFDVEMDFARVHTAPTLPTVRESAEKYLKAATISVDLARHIRSLGYSARAHISDSNYQIMLPPVARDAGLGEIGRLGYLISPRFGPRIRLGAVTTDLPLVVDGPTDFGVQDFCRTCLKCATNCPSGAIPSGDQTRVRGVEKWQLNIEQCIRYWRVLGTDCGLCMRVCPYSHPPTLIHNLVRVGIQRSAFARRIAARADDLFYGKHITPDKM